MWLDIVALSSPSDRGYWSDAPWLAPLMQSLAATDARALVRAVLSDTSYNMPAR